MVSEFSIVVGRVLIDVNGLRVSRPGAEVTTASAQDLIFNSNNGKYFAPFIKGTIGPSSFVEIYDSKTGAGSTRFVARHEAYVNFGRTFSYVPVALSMYYSNDAPISGQWISEYNFVVNHSTGQRQAICQMVTETNRLVFVAHRLRHAGGPGYLALPSVAYVVGRF